MLKNVTIFASMSETFTLTMSRPLKIGFTPPDFKKWDEVSAGDDKGIVIRVRWVSIGTLSYTIHPRKTFNKAWKYRLWFKWLKLRVWIGDFYK